MFFDKVINNAGKKISLCGHTPGSWICWPAAAAAYHASNMMEGFPMRLEEIERLPFFLTWWMRFDIERNSKSSFINIEQDREEIEKLSAKLPS